MLFLTDVNHVSSGKANETRQINLPSATASLQVVIGLCKRKETAALKFKAAASYRRVDRTAVRRLFSFAVARQFNNYLISIYSWHHYKNFHFVEHLVQILSFYIVNREKRKN